MAKKLANGDNDVRLRELDVAIENVLPLRGTAPITSQR